MTPEAIIQILSMIFWILPAIGQRKTEYFNFFIIATFADPIVYLLYKSFRFLPMNLYPLIICLQLISLPSSRNKKYNLLLIGATFIVSIFVFNNVDKIHIVCLILLLLILIVLFEKFIMHLYKKRAINVFLFLLTFYTSINVIKFGAVVFKYSLSMVSFYLGSFSELFIAVAFLFVTIDKPNIVIFKEELEDVEL